jgi:hypothetical protein
MRRSSELLKRLCLWALPMAALCAQSIKTGPEVGQQVPALSTTDQKGNPRTCSASPGRGKKIASESLRKAFQLRVREALRSPNRV